MSLTKIEKITKTNLKQQLGEEKGEQQFGRYIRAKEHLIVNVLANIKAMLPSHTDHDAEHIKNVLINAEKILDKAINKFSGLDLYCLILAILFHDAGNIFGREEHRSNISKIYDFVFPDSYAKTHEKMLILNIVAAHCGEGLYGSKDTLKDIDIGSSRFHLSGEQIKLRDIAAILRFADELAEGPQRTSLFMQQNHLYDVNSQIHHEYANITNISIDKGNDRIALTYEIDIKDINVIENEQEVKLRKLLEYTYKRIIKLNQERQYAKYYCDYLSPFKKTSVVFNFFINDKIYDLGLSEVNITDIVVPGDEHKQFDEYDRSYVITNIFQKLNQCLQSG